MPTYHSGRRLVLEIVRYLVTHIRYAIRPKEYPHFRLRTFLTVRRGDLAKILRVVRHRGFYYGASLRTPRWPSPAFDRMIVNGGMNLAPGLIAHKRHLDTAILSITRRCSYRCLHCYDSLNRAEDDVVPVEKWVDAVRALEARGVGVVILSGGEPMLRYDDLLAILDASDPELADIHIHSAGAGFTKGRARELASHGLVAAGIGLDYPDAERQDLFRGTPGAFSAAVQALADLGEAGVFTYTNLCLTKDLIEEDGLYRYIELAKSLKVGAVNLLEPKPCGRYASRDPDDLLSREDRGRVLAFFENVNGSRRFGGYPPVAYTAHFERPAGFGCLMGGLAHLSIDSNGEVNPCVFVPVSFGSILREGLPMILDRMRAANERPRYGACPAVLLQRAIASHRGRIGEPLVRYEEFREEWERHLSGAESPPVGAYR